MRIQLVLSYIGTAYHGWQIQETTEKTIQGALEKALSVFFREPVRVTGAGRTDAGVHALSQVAHADVPGLPKVDIRRSINALLPKDICVLSLSEVPANFHARFDAKRKTYVYRFWTESAFLPPDRRPFVWPCGHLDGDAMADAIRHVVGTHDFAALQNAGADTVTTVRTVLEASCTPCQKEDHLPPHAPEYLVRVTADGFLKQMVRNLAGILHAVGKGKIAPDEVARILSTAQRSDNPCPTAPACGLTLLDIAY